MIATPVGDPSPSWSVHPMEGQQQGAVIRVLNLSRQFSPEAYTAAVQEVLDSNDVITPMNIDRGFCHIIVPASKFKQFFQNTDVAEVRHAPGLAFRIRGRTPQGEPYVDFRNGRPPPTKKPKTTDYEAHPSIQHTPSPFNMANAFGSQFPMQTPPPPSPPTFSSPRSAVDSFSCNPMSSLPATFEGISPLFSLRTQEYFTIGCGSHLYPLQRMFPLTLYA